MVRGARIRYEPELNPSDNVESKRRALSCAPRYRHVIRDHGTSVGRTQCMSVSAAHAKKRCRSSIRVPFSIKQSPQSTTKSFADVREVSAELETTHPARPAACQTALGRVQAPYPLP